jgi:N-acetylmuramoyl-L-alanine amidase
MASAPATSLGALRRLATAGLLLLAVFTAAGIAAPAQPPARFPGQPQASRPFTVVLDAAHGGPDPGTELSAQLLEKSLVLQLSIRLRSALTARGMQVVTTREADVDPSADDRAGIANHARAQACIVLHATASGSGVHLYTSSLPQSSEPSGGLIPWSAAAAPFSTRSLQLSSALGAAFSSASIPYTLGRVRLAPLDSMRCPSVAVELAPLRPVDGRGSFLPLSDSDYQNRLVDAMADALVAWRGQNPAGAP